LAEFTVSSCAPLLSIDLPYAPHCKQSNDKIFGRIVALVPYWVILSAQWFSPDEVHIDRSSLNNTIDALKKAGVSHVLVGRPVPRWRDGLPECLQHYYKKHRSVPIRMTYGLQLFPELDSDLRERSRISGASYVSPIDLMCDEEGCLTKVGDNASDIVAWDSFHLTVAGAVYLVDRFPRALFGHASTRLQRKEPEQDFVSSKQ
jgi:SGNH domain (fused to AT3 domains)